MYIGVTNDLLRRMFEHRTKRIPGFTAKYNVRCLLYYETSDYVLGAIAREKQLKGWKREKKEALIRSVNPMFEDLYLTLS